MSKIKGKTKYGFENMKIGDTAIFEYGIPRWRENTNTIRASALMYAKKYGVTLAVKVNHKAGTVVVTRLEYVSIATANKKQNGRKANGKSGDAEYQAMVRQWRRNMRKITPQQFAKLIESKLKTTAEKCRVGAIVFWDFVAEKGARDLFAKYLVGNSWKELTDEQTIKALAKVGYPESFSTNNLNCMDARGVNAEY